MSALCQASPQSRVPPAPTVAVVNRAALPVRPDPPARTPTRPLSSPVSPVPMRSVARRPARAALQVLSASPQRLVQPPRALLARTLWAVRCSAPHVPPASTATVCSRPVSLSVRLAITRSAAEHSAFNAQRVTTALTRTKVSSTVHPVPTAPTERSTAPPVPLATTATAQIAVRAHAQRGSTRTKALWPAVCAIRVSSARHYPPRHPPTQQSVLRVVSAQREPRHVHRVPRVSLVM